MKSKIKKYSARWYADKLNIARSHAHRLLNKYMEETGNPRPSADALHAWAQRNAYYSNQWFNSPFYSQYYSP